MNNIDEGQESKCGCFSRLDFYFLIGLFLLALIPRLLYVIQIEAPPFSDEKDYVNCAVNFLTGRGLVMNDMYKAYRAPMYPLFLASIYKFWPGNVLLVRILQAIIGALLPIFLYMIIRLIPNKSSGWKEYIWPLLVGIQAAWMDSFIFYSGQLLTETIFSIQLAIFIFLCGLVSGSFSIKKSNLWIWIIIGIWAGITTLTRPVFLVIYPGMLIWLGYKVGIKNLKSTVLVAFSVCILVIIPWTIRNKLVTGYFVPVTTNTGVNFYIGHNPHYGYWSTGDKTTIRQSTDFNEVEESSYFFRVGLDYIKTKPGKTLKNMGLKIYNLYLAPWPSEKPFKPWPWFRHGRELRFARGIWWPTFSWGIIYLLFTLIGIVLAVYKKENWAIPLVWLIMIYSGSYVIFFTRARFLVPLIIVFHIFVGYLIFRLVARSRALKPSPPAPLPPAGEGRVRMNY